MSNILLVEDDSNLSFMLKEFLEMKGYSVNVARNGEEGKDKFLSGNFDLGIFDVMMPKKDGFWLGEVVRSNNPLFPIIFLTAKDNRRDAIKGFEIGADDYVTKPFSMEELLLRIKALLRRSQANTSNSGKHALTIEFGELLFNPDTRMLNWKDGEQKLTSKEAALLQLLIQRKNEVVERNIALSSIWGNDNYFSARSMDVYISKLRKILSVDPSIEILNAHGIGYSLAIKNPEA